MNKVFKNKRNVLMIMFALIVIMGIGFAAYSQQLTIKDTSSIDSNWNVYIKSVTPGTPVGGATGNGTVDNKTTATLATDLKYPGDSIEYTITVANEGNIDAEIEKVELKASKENTVIKYSIIDEANIQYLNSGDEKTFKVKVEYDPTKTGTATEEQKSNSLTLTVDYVQKGITIVPTSNIVYRLTANQLKIGDSIEGIETTTDPSTLGKNQYLKHEIEDNKITASYVCFVTDTEYCMQGGTEHYETNKAILQNQESWFKNKSGDCYVYDSYIDCYGGGFSDVETHSNGNVGAFGGGTNCFFIDGGTSYCNVSA